jgi:hypothetical protein
MDRVGIRVFLSLAVYDRFDDDFEFIVRRSILLCVLIFSIHV